jgi:hypothetical protein
MRRLQTALALAAAIASSVLAGCGPSVSQTAAPSLLSASAAFGSISGHFGYPSEGIPPMTIYAIRTTTGRPDFYTVHTIRNQGTYSIRGVAPGSYKLYADPAGGPTSVGHRFPAAYTAAVSCGLAYGCNDHSVLTVEVSAGAAATGINVTDWYAPENSFPVVPPGDPALVIASNPPPHYPDAGGAAAYEALHGTQARRLLSNFDQCPANESCVALGPAHDGTRAAYFVARAGSNSDVFDCGVYVFQDSAGWHPLNTSCGNYPAPGRSVGATFMGSGCINVRASPGYTSPILKCLPVDSTVSVDGGPVFLQESSPSESANLNRLWWHLSGLGWMAHEYLTFGSSS